MHKVQQQMNEADVPIVIT